MAEPQETPIPWNAKDRIACTFSFQCPKKWDQLESTSDPTVRHCSVCNQKVHLALTEEDFRRYSDQGMCVAVQIIPQTKESEASEVFMVGNLEEAPYTPKASQRRNST
ncbi:MAG: hypothetical protein R3B95_19900 [Nitrospirales bacterium]|nr:hypothetical protein [Nitrospirales bacterium]